MAFVADAIEFQGEGEGAVVSQRPLLRGEREAVGNQTQIEPGAGGFFNGGLGLKLHAVTMNKREQDAK